jgi:DNA-binding PadR family transcriptional regulator
MHMSASFALLGILGRQPSYGYELKRSYDALFGREKPLHFGQVYATLSRLLRDQKISANTSEQAAGPERKKYAITAKGRAELEKWLALPESMHTEARPILFTKVITAILLDTSPNEYLDTQRTAHIARMRELTGQRRKGDLAQLLQADYAIFHLEADLRWIDNTTTRLNSLIKEVREVQHGTQLH